MLRQVPTVCVVLCQVQLDSRGRKRPAGSDEPIDWRRYQKYDIFSDMLGAAAASPEAQVTPYMPAILFFPLAGLCCAEH